jgi:hypothetical protein
MVFSHRPEEIVGMHSVGRFLQLVGLIILPFAIAGNVVEQLSLKESLTMSGIGILVFSLGWLLQQGARPR